MERSAGRPPALLLASALRPGGGIGRRRGLKIPRPSGLASSSLALGTGELRHYPAAITSDNSLMPTYTYAKVPTKGDRIGYENGILKVPDNPIIPYIEGDGT